MIDVDRFFTDEELLAATGAMIFDVESYENYFLVSFLHYDTGKICFFEKHKDTVLQIDWIKWILRRFCIVGFNSNSYDLIALSYAISNESITTKQLKHITNEIIVNNMRSYELQMQYMFSMFPVNHVDLIEVAPLTGSLKTYAARLHCHHLEDLPYHPDTILSRQEKAHVRTYNFSDLDNTFLLCKELAPHLNLRAQISEKYGKDFRSLSDAQFAEEIMNSEIHKVTGKWPKKANFKKRIGEEFNYVPPSYVKFKNKNLQDMLKEITNAVFKIGETGHVVRPKEIENKRVLIDGTAYTVGIGGLHSVEKTQAVVATPDLLILDRDVTGYYPNMMLKNKFFPETLGPAFLEALQSIVDNRYKAKRSGDTVTADSLKIASNGTFGKTSDPYSTVYGPKMMVQTTLTGQLSILMTVEELAASGFRVISANTDGIVTIVEPSRRSEFENIFKSWENYTSLETEETEYKALYSRDVNNYFAVKMDGKIKQKGVYSYVGSALNSPLSKNPVQLVCIDAVVALIGKGTPIEETIHNCRKIERFTVVRKVVGGAQKDGRYLGKTVRWYYALGITGSISYASNGNKVALSDGAKPCMILPKELPADIDYARYVNDATIILEDIGFLTKRHLQFQLL